ncbi:hypothetical protein [Caballeronia sordidicola]|nr:hypothetical protein [Caballeronia sordidicola]
MTLMRFAVGNYSKRKIDAVERAASQKERDEKDRDCSAPIRAKKT